MTNGEIIKALKAHKGIVYACVNTTGGQYHLEVKKTVTLRFFEDYAATEGADHDAGLEAIERSGDLYIDTVVEE